MCQDTILLLYDISTDLAEPMLLGHLLSPQTQPLVLPGAPSLSYIRATAALLSPQDATMEFALHQRRFRVVTAVTQQYVRSFLTSTPIFILLISMFSRYFVNVLKGTGEALWQRVKLGGCCASSGAGAEAGASQSDTHA